MDGKNSFKRGDSAEICLDEFLFRQIVDCLKDAIFLHTPEGRIVYVNQRMLEMHGLPDLETVQRMNVPEHFSAHDSTAKRMQEVVDRMWRDGRHEFEWVSRHYPDGTPMPVEMMLHPIQDSAGRQFYLAQARDMRKRKRMEARLQQEMEQTRRALEKLQEAKQELLRHAATDPLTGIPNRRQFIDRFNEKLDLLKRHGTPFCLALLDIDWFKQVNDQHGHVFGDKVLVNVAKSLADAIRPSDVVARLGGDEFAMLFANASPDDAETALLRACYRVENASMTAPGGHALKVTVSAGLSAATRRDDNLEQVMQRADAELLAAKSAGRSTVRAGG